MRELTATRKSAAATEVISITIVLGILLLLTFVIPLATQNVSNSWYKNNNQYLIGPVVNTMLIYSGVRFKKVYNMMAVIMLPSLSAISLYLLGVNAIFLLYMVAFIWLGNAAISLSFRLSFRKANTAGSVRYGVTAVIGILAKAALIFGGFLVLKDFNVFPTPVAEKLSVMMGVTQLITAAIGAVIAFIVIKALRTSPRSLNIK